MFDVKDRREIAAKALDFRHFSASGSSRMVEWIIALRVIGQNVLMKTPPKPCK